VKLRPLVASWTEAVRAAGGPSSVPPGMKTVTGVLLFSAFTWSISCRRLPGSRVVTSGTRFCAWMVAVLLARSAANVRSTRASGTRNDTSTSELVATTSRTTRSLIRVR